jgi:trehalose 6-phosphate phosphatase
LTQLEPQPARIVPEEFWSQLRAAAERLLMLDYDGTLAPFTADRMDAAPYPGVRAALQSLIDDGSTRLVLISGRELSEIRQLMPLEPYPEVWGSHGHARWLNGELTEAPLSDELRSTLSQGEACARRIKPDAVEVKTACVAFHWRGKSSEDARRLEAELREQWEPLTAAGVSLHNFDGGLELRSDAMHKGRVVNQLLAELGSSYCAAYLGDDLTDEDAFAALGTRGLKVLVRPELRPTRAEVWLRPPAELLSFLDQWAKVIR